MEEAVCINDFGQCGTDVDSSHFDHLDNMDFNMVSHLLELNEEDLTEINQMVDDWEFNFGSLEVSEGEELLRLIDNMPQACQPFTELEDEVPATPSVQVVQPSQHADRRADAPGSSFTPNQLHDRLPSYYTACATSKSAPWIQPSTEQLFNKLPAYITDVGTLESAETPAAQAALPPAKKKLNLAEYRTRREKLLQEQKVVQQAREQEVRVKVEPSPIGKSPKRPVVKTEEPEEGEVDDEDSDVPKKDPPADRSRSPRGKRSPKRNIKRSRRRDDDDDNSSSSNSSSSSSSDSSPSPRKGRSRYRSSRSPTRSCYSSRSRSSSRRRYRSSSASSSSSSSSYSSRSRSRSPYRSRRRRPRRSRSPSWRRNRQRRRRTPTPPSYSSSSSSSSSSSRGYYSSEQRRRETERQRQIDERRVIYVGKLAEGTTRADLRKRFEVFGPVIDISLHFRERGDNYGFVTFAYKVDAYEAVEHGNDDPHLPKYDLSFGGRRAFCKTSYADLDAVDEDAQTQANEVDFETLLKTVRAQLHQRRPCS